jgi:hypothetical protein
MTASTAAFDVLAICRQLTRSAGGATAAELHVFSYLSCLLYVYDGHDAGGWGYSFAATPAGSPYARELADATDRVRAAGWLVDRGPVVVLSEAGRSELDALAAFASKAPRLRYLDSATAAATLLPLPSVADALAYEPQLRRALDHLGGLDELLDDEGLALVRPHFAAVAEALEDASVANAELLVPAVVWLTYLAGKAEEEMVSFDSRR